MTGGRRAPAVAHERAKKQDLGLDASSHFARWRGLAFIKRASKKKKGWGSYCPATPLSPPELHSFWISSLLKLFSLQRMCAASGSNVAPGGLQEHPGPGETLGPPVAGCRSSLKGWYEKGKCGPFLTKKTFKYQNYTWLHCYAGSKPHLKHHLLQLSIIWLLTCSLHFRLQCLHIFLHLGMIQWAGSILDLLNNLNML